MSTRAGYGMGLFPRDKRRALGVVHAFANRVDRLADGPLDPVEKLSRLDEQARALTGTNTDPARRVGVPRDPLMIELALARGSYGLPLDALENLIEGARMDIRGDPYESFDELLSHCRHTAGSVGRLCVAVCGTRGGECERERAAELADDLAVAMRLTDIVRNLRSDAESGRVYVPVEDFRRYHLLGEDGTAMTPVALLALARAGCVAEPQALAGLDGGEQAQFYALLRFQALRARDWFHRGVELAALLDRRSAAGVLGITAIYRRLLERIEDRPDRALGEVLSLGGPEQVWVAARGMIRRRLPERHPAERLP